MYSNRLHRNKVQAGGSTEAKSSTHVAKNGPFIMTQGKTTPRADAATEIEIRIPHDP